MKNIFFILAMLCTILTFSQDTLQYRLCTNCTNGENSFDLSTTYTYGNKTAYNSSGVTSDFGARYRAPNYDWHKGVDFKPQGCAPGDGCRGTAVVNLCKGTVKQIYADHGMKMIAIEGDSGRHYGYGHIFNSTLIGNTSINEGKFLIKKMNGNVGEFAIVDLVNNTAIGPITGTVTFTNGSNQTTTLNVIDTVNAGIDLAPMGGSCCSFKTNNGSGSNDKLPVHLHLYKFRDISLTDLVSETHETNCMNPLETVIHQTPTYSVKWQNQNQTTWNDISINPNGTIATKFKVRPVMQNVTNPAGQTISEIGSSPKYGNVVSDINKVEIQIKKSTDSVFYAYWGKVKDGLINLGGTSANSAYPTNIVGLAHPDENQLGSWTRQGIEAYAYADNNGHPYDEYYFTDFYSRVDNDFVTNLLTDIPNHANYIDGIYNLRATASKVNGISYNSNVDTFTLDNFQPFITKAAFRYNNSLAYNIKREQNEGVVNTKNDGYVTNVPYNPPVLSYGLPSQMEVEITTSEPMKNVKINHYPPVPQAPELNMDMVKDMNDPLVWRYTKIGFGVRAEECHGFTISGTDLSDNPIMNIGARTNGNDMTTHVILPTRKAATGSNAMQWTSPDSIHIGRDTFKVCFEGCTFLTGNESTGTRSTTDCENLAGVTSLVQYATCETPIIFIQNIDYPHYQISWHDANGPLPQYDNQHTLEVGAGTYCYHIQTINDCCDIDGCITVENENITQLQNVSISIDDCTGGDIDLGLDPSAYQIIWTSVSGTQMAELEGMSHISHLNTGTYCYNVRQYGSNCTFEACIPINIDHKLLRIKSGPLIFQPSDCNASNGNITFFPGSLDATYPCQYEWSNGITELSNFDLQSGEYTLTITDALGCTLEKSYTLGLIGENYFHIDGINDACEGESNGDIFLSVLGQINCIWNDASHTEGPVLNGVPSGTYCVDFYGVDGNNCNNQSCFEVPTIASDGTFEIVDEVVTPACRSEKNGSISFGVSGGNPPYTYRWHDDKEFLINFPNRQNLRAGVYKVSVTDRCGRVIAKDIILNEARFNPTINIGQDCGSNGSISIIGNGDFAPYTYHWQNGSTNSTITGLTQGVHSVTMTNNKGCDTIMHINNKIIEEIDREKSCVDHKNGSISIRIHNINGNHISVFFGDPQHIDGTTGILIHDSEGEEIIDITIDNLYGNVNYKLQIQGLCLDAINYDFRLNEYDYTRIFSRDTLIAGDAFPSCIYDAVCKNDTILDYEIRVPSMKKIPGTGCDATNSAIFEGCPKVGLYCNQSEIAVIQPAAVKIRAGEASVLCNQLGITPVDFLTSDPCAYVWACPGDPNCLYGPKFSGQWLFWGGIYKGDDPVNDTCREIICQFDWAFGIHWYDNFTICDDNFDWLPDPIANLLENNPPSKRCGEIVTVDFFQMIMSQKHLRQHMDGFLDSELDNYISNSGFYIDDLGVFHNNGDSDYLCATITFCKDNFTIEDINYEESNCSALDFNIPYYDDNNQYSVIGANCQPVPAIFMGQDAYMVVCNGIPRFYTEEDYHFFRMRKENDFKIITKQPGNSKFEEFIVSTDNFGHRYTNSIVSIGSKKYIDVFSKDYETLFDTLPFDHFTYDFRDNSYYGTYSGLKTGSGIYKYSSKGNHSTYLGSSYYLKVRNIMSENDTTTVISETLGNVIVDSLSTNIASNDTSLLYTVLDSTLNIIDYTQVYYEDFLEMKTIKNYVIFEYNPSYILTTNANILDPLNAGDIAICNLKNKTIFNDLNLEGNWEIKDFESVNGTQYYLLDGRGRINSKRENIFSDAANDNTVFISIKNDRINFVKVISKFGISTDSIFVEVDESNVSYLAFNVNENTTILQTSMAPQENDIAFFVFDAHGAQIAYNLYSSADNEWIRDMVYLDGAVFFGLDIEGNTIERKIGDVTFYKGIENQDQSVISYYLINRPFEDTITNQFTKQNLNQTSVFKEEAGKFNSLSVYPNPFNNTVTIDVNSSKIDETTLSVFDQLGKLIYSDNIPLGNGDNRYVLSDSKYWPNGIYFVNLNNIDGEPIRYKLIKIY